MELNLKKHKVEFFSSIKDLPFERFNEFNRYAMLDSEIGNTMEDFDKIVIRINEFLKKDLKEESIKELLNLRLVVNNVLSGTSHKGLSFACLIKKIDGEVVDDFSSDNLKKILQKLSDGGMTIGNVVDSSNEVKKK